jgi:hypothetical protein
VDLLHEKWQQRDTLATAGQLGGWQAAAPVI